MSHWRRIVNLFNLSDRPHPWPVGSQYAGATKFAVAETFFSIQGEGRWAGTPAWFIRLQGCSVGCPWCDTKHTWPTGDATVPYTEMVRQIPYNARHVVITGGEPFEQHIRKLLKAIDLTGRQVQVETSGCFDVERPGWITVSPKRFKPLSRQALKQADEIKQVVASEDDLRWMREEVLPYVGQWTPIYLQPVSNGKRAMDLCIAECKRIGYRLSVQLHKLIGVE